MCGSHLTPVVQTLDGREERRDETQESFSVSDDSVPLPLRKGFREEGTKGLVSVGRRERRTPRDNCPKGLGTQRERKEELEINRCQLSHEGNPLSGEALLD